LAGQLLRTLLPSILIFKRLILLQVPEKSRTAPRTQKPDDLFLRWHIDWRPLSAELAPMALAKEVKMMEWRCFALNAGRFDAKKCTLFLGNFCCL